MSGVFKRNRTETKIQFYVNALDLQKEFTEFVMREKVLPKKWRYAIGYPLIEKVDELVDNITYANSIFPTDEQELKKRKYYQTMAIANCYQVQNKIIRMEKCVATVKIEMLGKTMELLEHEITLLKSWKKTSKIIE